MLRIAVDGPAGSGKSSISKIIAEKYNLLYIDTGAMYRACAYVKIKYKCDNDSLLTLLKKSTIDLINSESGLNVIVSIDGIDEDVSDVIRTQEISNEVSLVASLQFVRDIMTERQKEIAAANSVIMDGRDIGTVVIPDAELKFFFIADLKERAVRRQMEWQGKGKYVDIENVMSEMAARDEADVNRSSAPLRKADNAIVVDTTNMSIEDVVSELSQYIDKLLYKEM